MKKIIKLMMPILSFSLFNIFGMEKKPLQGINKPNTFRKEKNTENENNCKYMVSTLNLVANYLVTVKEQIEKMPITDDISLNDVMIQQTKDMLKEKEGLPAILLSLKQQQVQYLKTRTLLIKQLQTLQEQSTNLNLAISLADTPLFKHAINTLNDPIDNLPVPSFMEQPFLASVVTEKKG